MVKIKVLGVFSVFASVFVFPIMLLVLMAMSMALWTERITLALKRPPGSKSMRTPVITMVLNRTQAQRRTVLKEPRSFPDFY